MANLLCRSDVGPSAARVVLAQEDQQIVRLHLIIIIIIIILKVHYLSRPCKYRVFGKYCPIERLRTFSELYLLIY